jgi:hypothetical protein
MSFDFDIDEFLSEEQNDSPPQNIVDLPQGLTLDWHAPADAPAERHLTADIIPALEFLNLRSRLGGTNPLAPRTPLSIPSFETLKQHPVSQKLGDELSFEEADMEPDTILFILDVVKMFQPRTILELGSGLSTVFLSDALPDTTTYVTVDDTIEQQSRTLDLAGKAGTAQKFKSIRLSPCHYRVGTHGDDDGKERVMPCYEFDEKILHDALGGQKPDMIIINGPTNEKTVSNASLAKTLTMPILSLYAAPGTLVTMSRAYADPEIFAMDQWQQSGSANIIGIKAVGKGLMIGIVPS